MQQRLGEARLADGTSVAYAVSGDGPPLLFVPGWVSHVELGWALARERDFFEALSHGRTLIRYDRPGFGLSGPSHGRDLIDLEEAVIEALVTDLELVRFDLFGSSLAAPLALRWAARHPETVDRLVVYGAWPDGSGLGSPETREQLLGLIRAHWGLGSEVITGIFAPEADVSFRATFAQHQRSSASPEEAERALAACYAVDIVDDLAQVRAPTTVIHREGDRAAPLAGAEQVAGAIAGATLRVLPGRSHIPYAGDASAVLDAIRSALDLPPLPRSTPGPLTPRQLEVAALVAAGHTNRTIAARLTISERTAESHVERIRQTLGLSSRTQLAAWYLTTRPQVR